MTVLGANLPVVVRKCVSQAGRACQRFGEFLLVGVGFGGPDMPEAAPDTAERAEAAANREFGHGKNAGAVRLRIGNGEGLPPLGKCLLEFVVTPRFIEWRATFLGLYLTIIIYVNCPCAIAY